MPACVEPPCLLGISAQIPPASISSHFPVPSHNDIPLTLSWLECDEVLGKDETDKALLEALGPSSLFSEYDPYAVLFCIVLLTGVFGSAASSVAIFRNRYLHTPTYVYMAALNMASILSLLTGIPYELFTAMKMYPWPFGDKICIAKHWLSETASEASILIVLAFTVDRFVAVIRPMRLFIRREKLAKVCKINIALWVLAAICAAPFAAQFGVEVVFVVSSNCTINRSAHCTLTEAREISHSLTASSLVFFVIPYGVIIVLLTLIGIRLYLSRHHLSTTFDSSCRPFNPPISPCPTPRLTASIHPQHPHSVAATLQSTPEHFGSAHCLPIHAEEAPREGNIMYNSRASDANKNIRLQFLEPVQSRGSAGGLERQTIPQQFPATQRVQNAYAILVSMCGLFFVCWAPFHLQRLTALHAEEGISGSVHLYFYFTVGVLYYSSAPLIPLLMSFLSPRFRAALVEVLLLRRAHNLNGSRSGVSREAASNSYFRRALEAFRRTELTARSHLQLRSVFRSAPIMASSNQLVPGERHNSGVIDGNSSSIRLRTASVSTRSVYLQLQQHYMRSRANTSATGCTRSFNRSPAISIQNIPGLNPVTLNSLETSILTRCRSEAFGSNLSTHTLPHVPGQCSRLLSTPVGRTQAFSPLKVIYSKRANSIHISSNPRVQVDATISSRPRALTLSVQTQIPTKHDTKNARLELINETETAL